LPFFLIIFFGILLVKNTVFFIPKASATDTILAIFTIKAIKKIEAVRTVLSERAVRELLAVDTFVAVLALPDQMSIHTMP